MFVMTAEAQQPLSDMKFRDDSGAATRLRMGAAAQQPQLQLIFGSAQEPHQ